MADEAIATGYFRLVPTTEGVEAAVSKQFGGIGTSAGKSFGSSFTPALGGVLALAGGALLAKEVTDFVSTGVAALAKIDTISKQTEAVIASTGNTANVSAEGIANLANSIEAKTATEAESIQQGANLLLTFKNIRNEAGAGNAIFDRTTASMVDMARAMGTDAQGGAIQLGKALNDPIKGIAALARVGITFSEDQKEMIASLVESNDLLGAQKIILDELDSQFGGSGAAYAESYAGKLELIENEYGNIQESIVDGLMPAFGEFADFTLESLRGISGSEDLASFVEKLNTVGSGAVDNLTVVRDIVAGLVASEEGLTFDGLASGLEAAFPSMGPFLDVVTALEPILPALADAAVQLAPALSEAVPELASLVNELLPLVPTVVPPAVDAIGNLADAITDAGPGIEGFAEHTANAIEFWGGAVSAIGDLFQGFSDPDFYAAAESGKYGTWVDDILLWGRDVETGFTLMGASVGNFFDVLGVSIDSAVTMASKPLQNVIDLINKIPGVNIPGIGADEVGVPVLSGVGGGAAGVGNPSWSGVGGLSQELIQPSTPAAHPLAESGGVGGGVGAGTGAQIHVHPQPGQSEMEIGQIAANELNGMQRGEQ
jgi:phage-related protein